MHHHASSCITMQHSAITIAIEITIEHTALTIAIKLTGT
jgi:hypothetical protein